MEISHHDYVQWSLPYHLQSIVSLYQGWPNLISWEPHIMKVPLCGSFIDKIIILITLCYAINVIKIIILSKKSRIEDVEEPHVAREPQFGHVCYIQINMRHTFSIKFKYVPTCLLTVLEVLSVGLNSIAFSWFSIFKRKLIFSEFMHYNIPYWNMWRI